MRGATDSREMLFSSGFLAVILGFPFGEAVGDSRLKRLSPVMSSLGASRHSPRRGKQELRRKLSLPRRGKQENDEPPPPKGSHEIRRSRKTNLIFIAGAHPREYKKILIFKEKLK